MDDLVLDGAETKGLLPGHCGGKRCGSSRQGSLIERHRPAPVEFLGSSGESIEVDLRGEQFAEMTDHDVIARAKATMSGAGTNGGDALRDEAGIDQTLDMP